MIIILFTGLKENYGQRKGWSDLLQHGLQLEE